MRLNDDEETILQAMEIHLGTDGSSVLRGSFLKHAREEGITLEIARKMVSDREKHKRSKSH